MRRGSFFWRLFLGTVFLIVLLATLVGALVSRSISRSSVDEMERSLRRDALMLRELSHSHLTFADEYQGMGRLQARLADLHQELDARLTVITIAGIVLGDTHFDPEQMDNHADRPELMEAAEHGEGRSRRFSRTLQAEFMYYAIGVQNGGQLVGFVRSALPLSTVEARLSDARRNVVLAALIAVGVALTGAFLFARRITGPLRDMTLAAQSMAEGHYDQRLYAPSTDEVGSLANAFNRMASNLSDHVGQVEENRNKILAILAAMREGVIAVDEYERVVHMNDAAASMVGVSVDECLERPVWEVVRFNDICDALTRTIRTRDGIERELRTPGVLTDRVFELQSSVLFDSDGGLNGAVVVLHDASELRRLEGVRQDFVSNVSHELKTPVAAIRGLVESILDDPAMESGVRQSFLTRVNQQCTRLTALVTDLLRLSAAEEKLSSEEGEPLDLRGPLRDSVTAHATPLEEKGLDLEEHLPDDPVLVVGDHEKLRQIFDNLIGNAIRYTAARGKIWVRARREGNLAIVEVEDTGIGIEPKHRDRVFERFYRVDKARSRELGGTGLGLAIVKHLVLAMGGEIVLHSIPSEGSRFTVRLPLHTRS